MYISFDVPDLNEFANGFPKYWKKMMFFSPVSKNFQINSLTTIYIRLVEAALVEFRLGRTKLMEYWNIHTSLNLAAMNRAISHFESCLSDMHRAIKCFRRLRRHKDLPKSLHLLVNANNPHFYTDQIFNQIGVFRNGIHHLEELVIDGQIQENQSITLIPDGPEVPHPSKFNQTTKIIDRLVMGQWELKFADLTAWLSEMAHVANNIASYNKSQQDQEA